MLDWYAGHYRSLPWRLDATAYHVWVSEIMLQQTRIETVIPYYHRFIDVLPDVSALANADTELLLKLWEGLGYYSRVRNLQKAAQVLVNDYAGEIPADYDRLLALPGIGEYTAGAIASIAFSIPVPAVDGNVMRVLARLIADDTDVLSTAGKKRFTDLAWQMVPEEDPGRFNQALMELGETICLPAKPECQHCPLKQQCEAYNQGRTNELPVRINKTKRHVEERAVALVKIDSDPPMVLLHKRGDSGLLAGLWELPNCLGDDALSAVPEVVREQCRYVEGLPTAKHLFSHIEWRMTATLYALPATVTLPDGYRAATLTQLQTAFPLPGAFRAYSRLFPKLLQEEK